MANMIPPEKESWKCSSCRKINKFRANYCPKCSRPWQEVIDRQFVDPRNLAPKSPRRQGYSYVPDQSFSEPWDYQQWERSPRKRTQSPRQRFQNQPRAQSRGRGGKGKGQWNQSHGKGKAAPLVDAGGNQFPSAPAVPKASSWMQMMPMAASTAAPPPPLPAAPMIDPVKMKELFSLLDKRQDQLTPDIQAKMQEMKVEEVQVERKHMHNAVDHHSDAKQDLAAAHQARGQIHSSWIAFLSASMQQWKEFADQFAAQERAAVDRIHAAQATYQKACELLDREKQKIGLASSSEVTPISDEETESKEVSTVSSQQITEGMQHLSTTLASLHSAAQALAAQEHAAKRPRIEAVPGPADAPMGSGPGSKALEPFGGAN